MSAEPFRIDRIDGNHLVYVFDDAPPCLFAFQKREHVIERHMSGYGISPTSIIYSADMRMETRAGYALLEQPKTKNGSSCLYYKKAFDQPVGTDAFIDGPELCGKTGLAPLGMIYRKMVVKKQISDEAYWHTEPGHVPEALAPHFYAQPTNIFNVVTAPSYFDGESKRPMMTIKRILERACEELDLKGVRLEDFRRIITVFPGRNLDEQERLAEENPAMANLYRRPWYVHGRSRHRFSPEDTNFCRDLTELCREKSWAVYFQEHWRRSPKHPVRPWALVHTSENSGFAVQPINDGYQYCPAEFEGRFFAEPKEGWRTFSCAEECFRRMIAEATRAHSRRASAAVANGDGTERSWSIIENEPNRPRPGTPAPRRDWVEHF